MTVYQAQLAILKEINQLLRPGWCLCCVPFAANFFILVMIQTIMRVEISEYNVIHGWRNRASIADPVSNNDFLTTTVLVHDCVGA